MYASAPRAGFARRLSAIIYDVLVLCAVIMAAAGLAFMLVHGLDILQLIDLTQYEDTADFFSQSLQRWLYFAYLLSAAVGFYAYFWVRAGQTLGMRAWRLLLLQQNGQKITLQQAVLRALLAFAGLGNFWLFIRWGKGLALQDQLTNTQMVLISKEQSKQLNLYKTAR
ncbi:RDD family protein [Alkalimonas collagenimarina]|uniref:RDD family protein n=1 Tax=Alkalimonas collagenimarina TaxID=400390 RepID=A0ABT9H3J3_9GAMM|nr:RDD family protein [Alkalimonas collagenimarina]MDP4537882.1 RDD family protein [Alkalimonas collagenimarina]